MDPLPDRDSGAIQSFGIAFSLQKGGDFVTNPGIGFILMTMLTLTTGSAFIMWLGEQITERGIGNGMSLLIFAGIVVGLPRGICDLYGKVQDNAWGAFTAPGDHHADCDHGRGGRRSSSLWSAASGVSRCSMPSAWSDAR